MSAQPPSKTRVLKFGGSSVATPERIHAVAQIVAAHRIHTPRLVVVVSAMGYTTDDLIALGLKVSPHALTPRHRREMDMLLSTGERVSMALLSMALSDIGVEAVSFTGSQSGIITDTVHGEARIAEIRPFRIEESLALGKVVIVAGFQGVSRSKEITTLGRGGSDTTAVALACALKADETVIYTDVDGFYTADPRVVVGAKKLDAMPWESAVEAASLGAQVLHPRCVELAWSAGMPIRVCSSFRGPQFARANSPQGTVVKGEVLMESSVEGPKILSVALQKSLSRCVVKLQKSEEGAALFSKLCAAGFRAASWSQQDNEVKILAEASQLPILERVVPHFERKSEVARVSLVGSGLAQNPEVMDEFQQTVLSSGAHIVSTRISSTSLEIAFGGVDSSKTLELLRALHDHFETA